MNTEQVNNMKYFLLFFILHVAGFYIFSTMAVIIIAALFYSYFIDRCSLYILPISILPLPVALLPIISATGMGNFRALTMFNAAMETTVVFFVATVVISFFMTKRKRKREELGLKFYSGKYTPLVIMLSGVVIGIAFGIAITIYAVFSSMPPI